MRSFSFYFAVIHFDSMVDIWTYGRTKISDLDIHARYLGQLIWYENGFVVTKLSRSFLKDELSVNTTFSFACVSAE